MSNGYELMMNHQHSQKGSALITALLVIGLCSTLIAGMAWQQRLQISHVEVLRNKVQVNWLQRGAVDWARLILTEDAKANTFDHLGEVWSLPIADSQLDDFLKKVELGIEVKSTSLNGQLIDAQSRFNLRNLWDADYKNQQGVQVLIFERFLEISGVDKKYAQQLVQNVIERDLPPSNLRDVPLILGMSDIEWQRIKTSLIFLPQLTTINVNTASANILYASINNINQSDADNIIAYRNKQPFKSISDLKTYLNDSGLANLQQNAFAQLGVSSQFFIAQAEIKHDQTIFVRNSLIERGLRATSSNNTRIIWELDPRDM